MPQIENKPTKLTFLRPDVFKKVQGRKGLVRDEEASEEFLLMETLGCPKVFYAVKSNQYFKDPDCDHKFTDTELQALGLPIPVEIKAARTRLMKAALDASEVPDMPAIYRATSPKSLPLPEHLKARFDHRPVEEKTIARINRSSLA